MKTNNEPLTDSLKYKNRLISACFSMEILLDLK